MMKNEKGFTIVEIVIVIVIVGILAAVAIPITGNIIANSQVTATEAEMVEIQKAIMGDGSFRGYRNDVGSLPATLAVLTAAGSGYNPFLQTGNRGRYLSDASNDGDATADILQDAWENTYQWNNSTGVITSYGADGAVGGTGFNADITLDVDG